MKEWANETRKRVEPTAHLCCGGGGSLHTWDTMRSSRLLIVMMTTTAKVATLQATSMPEAHGPDLSLRGNAAKSSWSQCRSTTV